MLGAALRHLGDVLQLFAASGFVCLKQEWAACDALTGKGVAVTMADRSEHLGMAAGVSDDGALLVQTASGLRRFHSGEVSLRPLDRGLRMTG